MKAHDSESGRLTAAHRAALSHIQDLVRGREQVTSPRVLEFLRRAGCTLETYREAMECVRRHARVVVHFHPDRIGIQSKTVAQALFEEGVYRSQFETGLSTASLTAFPGGPRDTWERQLFGGAYHTQPGPRLVQGDTWEWDGKSWISRQDMGPAPRYGARLTYDSNRQKMVLFGGAGAPDAQGKHPQLHDTWELAVS